MADNNQYFAKKEAQDAASVLLKKAEYWSKGIITTNYLNRCKRSWYAYNGSYFDQNSDTHQVLFAGEQGELVQIAINHYRNIGTHLLNITTANRPAMEANATNSDYKSLSQTILANGLLDYYMTEKRLEEYLRTAVEYAIVLGEGYVRLEWDEAGGQEFGFNEETQTIVYEGDIRFTNHSPFDVIRDNSREDQDNDWLTIRTFKNRYDLMAKHPELADKIAGIPSKDEVTMQLTSSFIDDETDLIPVYEFYHKRTAAVPDGRYMIFVSPDAVLFDGPLPYRFIPVFRMTPSNIIGAPFGYTPLFDLLPIQDAVNTLYSTVLTNQNAFGVQNILIPKGSDINISSLAGGLNLVEYDAISQNKPEALNLTKTPAEVFSFIQTLETSMETISGINSVVRGNPEASLESGTALAMVQSQAIQFASGLQQSYIRLVEDVGTAIIKILQDYATAPRVAAIVGKSNRMYMKEFKADDISKINRVKVRVANPLAKTTAGRMEIANNLITMNLITNIDQYFTVLNTGNLESMIEGDQAELLLIRSENEKMMEGESVPVTAIDMHVIHIKEHRALLADPDLRKDAQLVQIVLDHIQEHINALRTVDPSLLQLLGMQPMPPAAQPMPPQGQQGPPTQAQGAAGQAVAENIQAPLPVGVDQANQIREPSMPRPSGDPNQPITAAEGMANQIAQK